MPNFELRKQRLDLSRLHDECERNYQRLQKVSLDSAKMGSLAHLNFPQKPNAGLSTEVIDVSRYSSTLNIKADQAGPQWMPQIEIKARVYRDAKMLEVIEWCTDRTIPWELSEEKGMQARDEKWQWNIFLSELLIYGLRHGSALAKA